MTGRQHPGNNPFDLDNDAAYQNWRSKKLDLLPRRVSDLIVPITNTEHLQQDEITALLSLIQRSNMAIYDTGRSGLVSKDFVRLMGGAFGLTRLDSNPLSDDDDISSITVKSPDQGARYIPYTDRPISWHTDGYYNAPELQVRSFILHCVCPAASGGENRLLDPELAYIHLRDGNRDHIRALMAADAMTIPANEMNDQISRPRQSGPVFLVQPDGALQMRFTARRRHVIWPDEPLINQARQSLSALLDSDTGFIYRHRLEAGQGLIGNNVLHSRAVFKDQPGGQPARLLYRARYHDRIRGTGPADFLEAI